MSDNTQRNNPFQDMPQYPINREAFRDIFRKIDDYACDGLLPYEGPDFKFWHYDDDVYILHKPSGTLVNWYKLGHTGRANTCNKALTVAEYNKLAHMLIAELKEYGEEDYDWEDE